MEKISFQPLITELSDKSSLYNQWHKDTEIKYGNLPSPTIVLWMTEVVEPIVKKTFELNPASEKMHEVVKSLYIESLKLIGSGLAIRYKEEYQAAWLLMTEMPGLVLKFPSKTITLLNDVLLNLNTYSSDKILDWCQLMKNTSVEIKTIEDFKIAGRIYAWKCGLAHLRSRLKADFGKLSENLQECIAKNMDLPQDANQIFEKPWLNAETKFEGVQGGFKSEIGFFEHPPKLAQIDEHVFVTDSKNSYAIFADQFGKVLLPANTVDANYILSNAKRFDTMEKWLRKSDAEIHPDTVSSSVITKDTLIFTLQNSYFIFLFSLGNG